jgi:hypothetical protein
MSLSENSPPLYLLSLSKEKRNCTFCINVPQIQALYRELQSWVVLVKALLSFVAIMILFWVLNLAGVLVSMGMEMEIEMEKKVILWDGGLYGWMIVWIDGLYGWMDGWMLGLIARYPWVVLA